MLRGVLAGTDPNAVALTRSSACVAVATQLVVVAVESLGVAAPAMPPAITVAPAISADAAPRQTALRLRPAPVRSLVTIRNLILGSSSPIQKVVMNMTLMTIR